MSTIKDVVEFVESRLKEYGSMSHEETIYLLTILKSIEKVTGEEINEIEMKHGPFEWGHDRRDYVAKHISKRIFGEE